MVVGYHHFRKPPYEANSLDKTFLLTDRWMSFCWGIDGSEISAISLRC